MNVQYAPSRSPAGMVDTVSIYDVLARELSAILDRPFEEIDPAKSLDEYGLDSIDAVIIAGTLSQRLGIELPPELLIQYRCFDDIAAAVERLSQPHEALAKTVTSPVFLFPGGAGRDGRLAFLAARCDEQVPSRIILIGSWHNWVAKKLRLQDIVATACDEIEASSPSGPLRLAGYSQGGALAFAVTLALQARGRVVQSLIIFDTPMDGTWQGGAPRAGFLRESWYFIRRLGKALKAYRVAGEIRVFVVTELFRFLPAVAANALVRAAARTPVLLWGRGGTRVDNFMQMVAFALLWDAWRPSATVLTDDRCRTVLFRSEDNEDGDLGWARYCPSLTIVPVDGGHHTMFDLGNVDALAAKFVAALNEA